MSDPLITDSRATKDIISAQAKLIGKWDGIRVVLDAIPDVLLVVNGTRQIIFANQAALEFFQVRNLSDVLGQRPGEAIGCVHSHESPDGCGSSKSCRVCGAFEAIQKALEGQTTTEECRILRAGPIALDLKVWAWPFEVEGERFLFLSIRDISSEKRREALERIFFHDLLNTAGGLHSITEILEGSTPGELRELREVIAGLSEQLVDEIQSQRDLLSAERGELHAQQRKLNSRDIVSRVIGLYLRHQTCDGKSVQTAEFCQEVTFFSDPALVIRVLGNLLRNALEATPLGGTVLIGCQEIDAVTLEFFVHNSAHIPANSALQIFNRSFSTKGSDRGLGTYGAKLITERFLDGKIDFTSKPREGTLFFVRLPRKCPA